MTDEQVLLLAESFSLMSGLDSFIGCFLAIAFWKFIDWLAVAFRLKKITP